MRLPLAAVLFCCGAISVSHAQAPALAREASVTVAPAKNTPLSSAASPSINSSPKVAAPSELDLRQLWSELKLNNPQLAALRESYFAAKATVPQIAAPANPQVGLVWSGMPANSPLARAERTPPKMPVRGVASATSSTVTAQQSGGEWTGSAGELS